MYIDDYYSVLEIPSFSSEHEIRQGYKRVARKYHPDVNRSEGATEKMQLINEAYFVLKDKSQKILYDIEFQKVYRSDLDQKMDSFNVGSRDSNIEDELFSSIKKAKKMAFELKDKGLEELIGPFVAGVSGAMKIFIELIILIFIVYFGLYLYVHFFV